MSRVDRDELISQIKIQAYTVVMFSSNEPQFDLPEPEDMGDLDSFSVVQMLLALEDSYEVMLLEDFSSFKGENFADLADFILQKMDEKEQAGA